MGTRRDPGKRPTHRPLTRPKRLLPGTFARVRTLGSTRALTGSALVLALLGGVTAGCSLTEDDEPTTSASIPATTETSPAATPTPRPTTPQTQPEPSKESSSLPAGSGDGEEDDAPATAGGGICSDLDATDVAAALGGNVTGAGLAPAGCEFRQGDSAAPSATFVEASFARTPGGMSGAKSNATASVEGEPQDLRGIGTAAFVVTGTQFGGEAIQGAGAVRVGDRLIQVTLAQGSGLSGARVKALVVNLLELAADKAS